MTASVPKDQTIKGLKKHTIYQDKNTICKLSSYKTTVKQQLNGEKR